MYARSILGSTSERVPAQVRSQVWWTFSTHLQPPQCLMLPHHDRHLDSGSTSPGEHGRPFPAAISSCEHGTIRRETSIGVIARCSVSPFPGDASVTRTRYGPSLHPGSPIRVNLMSDGLTDQAGKSEL